MTRSLASHKASDQYSYAFIIEASSLDTVLRSVGNVKNVTAKKRLNLICCRSRSELDKSTWILPKFHQWLQSLWRKIVNANIEKLQLSYFKITLVLHQKSFPCSDSESVVHFLTSCRPFDRYC